MPLASPAISELAVESSALALLNEFLKGYFDGGAHVVGARSTATTFPLAQLRFQQSRLPQPLKGLGISVVTMGKGKPVVRWETVDGKRSQIGTLAVRYFFYIRHRAPNEGAGSSEKLVMTAGELLYGLLRNSKATQPLSQKGVLHLRPSAPELASKGDAGTGGVTAPDNPDNDFDMRVVMCQAQLRYEIKSQG